MDLARYRIRLVLSAATIALISVPLILRMVPPNGIYGFRTSLTQSSDAVWYAANAFMGWALIGAAIVSGVSVMRLPSTARRWSLLLTFVAPIAAAIVVSLLYVERFR